MKIIEPIGIWNGGSSKQAVYFDLVCKYDDLVESATFYYYLYDNKMTLLASVGGNEPALVMTGDIYDGWTNNDYAYDWAADKLDIVILGPYITPSPTPTVTPTNTPTTTQTPTVTPTNTETNIPTLTPTPSVTQTSTPTSGAS